MKARVFLLILGLLSLTHFIAGAEDNGCSEAALLNGDPRGPFVFPENCRKHVLENASAEQKVILQEGELKTFAGTNYVLTYVTEKELLLAGEETLLKNIIAISVNMRNHNLIVVDSPNSIKTFDHLVSGNVAPLYHLQTPEIEGASFAVSNEKLEQLAVAFTEEGKIKFFKLKADIHGRASDNHTKTLFTVNTRELGVPAPTHLAYDPLLEQLLVYDKSGRKMVALDWKNRTPKMSASARFPASEAPERIDYHEDMKAAGGVFEGKKLKVFDRNLKIKKARSHSAPSSIPPVAKKQ